MARDLDFSPRRQVVKPTIATAPRTTPSPAVASPKGLKSIWLWLVIILLVAGATWALWQSLQPVSSPTAVKPVLTASEPTSSGLQKKSSTAPQEATSSNLFSPQQSGSIKIQIYNSGAGENAVAALQDKLKVLGYGSENLDKSQFNYDKTYIWYRAGLESEATKIQSTMPERVTSLKQIASSGLFDVLIYLGTK